MTSTEQRLVRLEEHIGNACCSTCQHWYGYPIVFCDEAGNETGRTEEAVCPDCGRKVRQRHAVELAGLSVEDMP